MARKILGLAMVVGLLLAMVPNTTQLRLFGPNLDGPFVGLILSTAADEKLLLESGLFSPQTSLVIAGRTFNVGTFNGVPTIYVIAVAPLAHVSATVQIMVDIFYPVGIIDYGNAASVSPSVKFADVAVLSETAFTSAWTWKEYKDAKELATDELPSLKIGDYNVPKGENELGSLQYQKIKKYTPKGSNKEAFWYYTDPHWLQIASQLKDITLERCLDQSVCTIHAPSVKYGVKGSSSDVYVQNEAYGKFLHDQLNVSIADIKSAATVSTAVANGVKHIVFRAASNKPGVPYEQSLGELASKNNLKVVSEFVKILANEPPLSFDATKKLRSLIKYVFHSVS